MSFFTFLTELSDLFQNASIGCGLGDQADFPFTNTQLSDISTIYKAVEVTGPIDGIIDIDFGASHPWNQVVIVNHNILPGTTITVKSGTTGGVVEHSDTMTWREFDMYFRTASTRTDRYMTIRIQDPDTSLHYVSIGRILVGFATTLANNFNYDWEQRFYQVNRSSRSDVHSRSVDVITSYREFSFTFSEMTSAQLTTLIDFVKSLKGDAVYLFLIPDPDTYDGALVTLSTNPVRAIMNRRHRISELVFSEESRGVRTPA